MRKLIKWVQPQPYSLWSFALSISKPFRLLQKHITPSTSHCAQLFSESHLLTSPWFLAYPFLFLLSSLRDNSAISVAASWSILFLFSVPLQAISQNPTLPVRNAACTLHLDIYPLLSLAAPDCHHARICEPLVRLVHQSCKAISQDWGTSRCKLSPKDWHPTKENYICLPRGIHRPCWVLADFRPWICHPPNRGCWNKRVQGHSDTHENVHASLQQ